MKNKICPNLGKIVSTINASMQGSKQDLPPLPKGTIFEKEHPEIYQDNEIEKYPRRL